MNSIAQTRGGKSGQAERGGERAHASGANFRPKTGRMHGKRGNEVGYMCVKSSKQVHKIFEYFKLPRARASNILVQRFFFAKYQRHISIWNSDMTSKMIRGGGRQTRHQSILLWLFIFNNRRRRWDF